MRIILRFISCIIVVLYFFNVSCSGLYLEEDISDSVRSFAEESVAIIQKYDTQKNLNTYKIEESGDYTSSNEASPEASSFSNAYQTCRLIVSSSKKIDKLNSVAIASGFKDWYIVQFESEEDTKKAYDFYKIQSETKSLAVDQVYQNEDSILEDQLASNSKNNSVPLDSWAAERTGLYDVKKWFQNNAYLYTSEVKVAILDSGIDLSKEVFQNRVYRTFFNGSLGGETDSENVSSQLTLNAHGTAISSVIVDSTPPNIKIGMYKVGHNKQFNISALSAAVLKAVSDGAEVINMSLMFSGQKDDSFKLFEDALDYAVEQNVIPVAAAGNSAIDYNSYKKYPQSFGSCFVVTASQPSDTPAGFSNFGKDAFICAPGVDVPAEYPGGMVSGTSISSPLVCAAIAMIRMKSPNIGKNEIEHIIKKSAAPFNYPLFNGFDVLGSGILDLVSAMGFERVHTPSAIIECDDLNGSALAEIKDFDIKTEVYYSTDGSYPSRTKGIRYTSAIELSGEIDQLRFVAYDPENILFPSNCVTETFFMHTLGTDDMFEIDENGIIQKYCGSVYDLVIPEYVHGQRVIGLEDGVFRESTFHAVTFPDSIDTIPDEAFLGNTEIQIVNGNGITYIGKSAFEDSTLIHINTPNVKEIGEEAFENTRSLIEVDFPECLILKDKAFYNSRIMYVSFEKIETLCSYAFSKDSSLVRVFIPNVIELKPIWSYIDDETGEEIFSRASAFEQSTITEPIIFNNAVYISPCTFEQALSYRAEFSSAKRIDSLPMDACLYNGNIITVALPSTMETCMISSIPDDCWTAPASSYYFDYHIFGTRGTYAEYWALDNNYKFFEVSQETALITDLPTEYYDYMFHLDADVVGFNKSYQWFGATSNSNVGGIPIDGANASRFIPKDSEQYPYYYCVVTSTDIGYDPIEIRTGASKYMNYKAETVEPADYSALDEMLAAIPEDLSIYTDESVEALNNVIDSIDRNLDVSNQATVYGYVEAISSALSALKLKEHMVSFIVDNKSVLSYELEYGSEITDIPPNPDKTGYIFSKWTPDIPPAMPNNSLTFTAEFEPATYYASFMVDGEEIENVPFTVESESISEPKIPDKEGCTGKWSEYIIAASNITINAEYSINDYTVSFVADDKIIKSEIVKYGSPIEVPDNPQKNGYIFKEWLPKVPETMPAEDMTFYAVFEEEKQPEIKPEVGIRNFVNSRTVDYRTTITLTTTADNIPEGVTIIWYKDGQKSGTGEKFTVKEARESFTVQAKIVDESGTVLNVTETELVKVKTDFFSKIIAFFRMLFGKLPIIEQ